MGPINIYGIYDVCPATDAEVPQLRSSAAAALAAASAPGRVAAVNRAGSDELQRRRRRRARAVPRAPNKSELTPHEHVIKPIFRVEPACFPLQTTATRCFPCRIT
jgi:hypothetical protein